MLKKLRFLPRGRTLLWVAVLLFAGPPVLLGLMLLIAVTTNADVRIDATEVVLAVAVAILAAAALVWLAHRQKPRQTVTIGYSYKLIQPAIPLGRYRFELEIYHELEVKGESRRSQAARVEIAFRRNDHPELLDWCRREIGAHLEQHRGIALRRYPEAEVLVSLPPRALEASGSE